MRLPGYRTMKIAVFNESTATTLPRIRSGKQKKPGSAGQMERD
jgi:hypothetical protein